MQDASAHCAALVRAADGDRYVGTLFAPAERRSALFALYAFDAEVTRACEAARQPLAGEVRLQWWAEVLRGEREGEAQAHPVAAALTRTITDYNLSCDVLRTAVDARRDDFYDGAIPTFSALTSYAEQTRGTIIRLATHILGASGEGIGEVANLVAVVQIYADILRKIRRHAAGIERLVPDQALEMHRAERADLVARHATREVAVALAELILRGRGLLLSANAKLANVEDAALPAFLPAAPLRRALLRLERHYRSPFRPAELSALQRQWLIFRAAHDRRRILS